MLYYGKTWTCGKMIKKIHNDFVIVEDGKLRKLLGVRYKWKVFDPGGMYVVMSMNDKAEK